MALRLFSDRAFIPDGTLFMDLFVPFWGPNEGQFESMQPTRVARYVAQHADFLTLGSLAECDFAVFPVEYQLCTHPDRERLLLDFAALAHRAGKPVVVFIGGDLNRHPPVGDFVFHTALYRATLRANTFGMPPILEDLAERHLGGEVPVRGKTPVPSVSFCGAAPPHGLPPGKRWLKKHLRVLGYRAGLVKGPTVGYAPRALAVRALRRARRLRGDLVIRAQGYAQFQWGHLVVADEAGNAVAAPAAADYRLGYVRSLTGSDYVLCARGLGNYSLRLYECLCVGRIPVIVNTDMVFPLEDLIDWRSVGVWIEESELPRLEEKILEFHRRQTDASFLALQRRSREIWSKYISPEGFYAHAFQRLPLQGKA